MKWIYKILWLIIWIFIIFVLWLWVDFYLTQKKIKENWIESLDTSNLNLWFINVDLDTEPIQSSKFDIDINEILFYQKYFNKYKTLTCSALTWNVNFKRNYILDLSTYEFNKRINSVLNNNKNE